MATRSVLPQDTWKRFIIPAMWRSAWKSALLWAPLPERMWSGKIPIRMMSSFFLEAGQDGTAAAVQQVPPKYIRKVPLKNAAQRCRREMHPRSVRYRGFSAEGKSAGSSRNVMISAQGACQLPLGNWLPALW